MLSGLAGIAAAYSGGLLVLSAIHALAPQRDGLLAISQIGAPHLFAPLLVLAPLAILRVRGIALVVVVAAALVGVVRFGPGMLSLPASATPDEPTLGVATWNLAAGDVAAGLLVERLLKSDAAIVALPELKREHVAAIEASDELVEGYPHRLLAAHRSVLGMGVVSAYPLSERSSGTDPPHIMADVMLPGGQTLVVLAAHPLPARFNLLGDVFPVDYYAGERDHELAHLRSMFEADLAAGSPVLLLGDFNVTDREPGYDSFSAGLRDAHREVGIGPGSTWRPLRLSALPFGILRIDYVFTGGAARPIATSVECVPDGGDHCLVGATVAVRPRSRR